MNEIADKLDVVHNANKKTKEEILQQIVAKDVIENKNDIVAGQLFVE